MSETATPSSTFPELPLWCGVLLLALVGIFTLIRINSEDTSEQALAVYKNQLRTYAQNYLERARIEQASDNSLAPTLLYVGKDAKIVQQAM